MKNNKDNKESSNKLDTSSTDNSNEKSDANPEFQHIDTSAERHLGNYPKTIFDDKQLFQNSYLLIFNPTEAPGELQLTPSQKALRFILEAGEKEVSYNIIGNVIFFKAYFLISHFDEQIKEKKLNQILYYELMEHPNNTIKNKA